MSTMSMVVARSHFCFYYTATLTYLHYRGQLHNLSTYYVWDKLIVSREQQKMGFSMLHIIKNYINIEKLKMH